jgi:hypothetical protein
MKHEGNPCVTNVPNENSNIAQNSADNYNNNGEIIEENENLIKSYHVII